ncbi:uncharacterized protein BDR25DRAFT_385737 [Lindgomyces ingoldianus]|uniref:Uncharacterized protein n=1 Tax=Lindgomyces ingoldianus TaxID=673940 RepID=A0ACB6R611_9PLEO|nr:uncharacterized protein BDR25DRAFT_385737 [Lindgomyces ingoldianus]KAF2474278.1 hypothetical protein BDR25DRAFT_385737 [Lindgomyces ingoldianus]
MHGPTSNNPKPLKTFTIAALRGLMNFDKNVDQTALDRFKDVVERVEGPLIECVRIRGREYRPMAIRLTVLGGDYIDAKPRIVVLRPEKSSKRVKKFFQQTMAKSICCPNDCSQTQFDVTVIGQTLRTQNTQAIAGVYGALMDLVNDRWWSSSALIKISRPEETRYGTIGGIVKIVKANGDFVLCGFIAGYILDGSDHSQSDLAEMKWSPDLDTSSDEENSADQEMPDTDSFRYTSGLAEEPVDVVDLGPS